MEIRKLALKGLLWSGLGTGIYLAVNSIPNTPFINTLLGWVLGVSAVGTLMIDGFNMKSWQGRTVVTTAILGVIASFYLLSSFIPNSAVTNTYLGLGLIATSLFLVIREGF